VGSFESAPTELVLDFDCTDDRVHGLQEGRHFTVIITTFAFYRCMSFAANGCWSVTCVRVISIQPNTLGDLALLVKALRQRWPELKITVRADSGFCRWKMLRCASERESTTSSTGKNERLHALSAKWQKRAERSTKGAEKKCGSSLNLSISAELGSEATVIAKAEHSLKGANPRYVLTNLEGRAQALYDEIYCARGEMENRIKEQQLGLFSDRTSCHAWWANQFRSCSLRWLTCS